MSQPLPIGEYQWVPQTSIDMNFNTSDHQKNVEMILNLEENSDIGYIFEVDLHYPEELHNEHNDFPFCPEKRGVPGITKTDKLMLTFFDKKKYIVHYSMLKLILEHKLVLKKVHRVLQFKQAAFLKKYIDLNTNLRAQANNAFERDFFKLLNNAAFGKSMENLRLRTDIRLVNEWYGRGKNNARNLIAQPNFKKLTFFAEDLIAIELHKSHILMNKPIITGMVILERSKELMYKFMYNYLKPKYGQNIRLVYTDTDSFILEIKTDDVYADIRNEPDINEFDTWDYPEENIYGIKRHNNKVIGKFKDELKGRIISEVVGLRSKCYAVRTYGKIDKKKKAKNIMKRAKGVKKNVLENTISFNDYYNCVKNNCVELRKQYSIRSKKHDVYTISTMKLALNPYDDKRYIIKPDCIDTLAWGHYQLDSEKMKQENQYVLNISKNMKEILKN